jgi:hypothetical protein
VINHQHDPVVHHKKHPKVLSVAAGGGSICFFENGRLQVGPKSAGAFPGPACYGAGGPLTLSDVNILLGKMDPFCFSIPIFPEKAEEKFLQLVQELDLFYEIKHQPIDVLKGLERIGNEKMADAIRSISLSKGFNPKDYPLLSFGGAGGLHACAMADLLGINTVLIPYDAGILSAFGIGKASIERFSEREIRMPLLSAENHSISVVKELVTDCTMNLHRAGVASEDIGPPKISYFLRFSGQESALEIQSSHFNDLSAAFKKEYKHIFGYFPADRPIELVRIMVRLSTLDNAEPEVNGNQNLYFPNENHFSKAIFSDDHYPVFLRDKLYPGATIDGPAILLTPTSSAFIPEYWQCCIDKMGLAVLKKTKEVYLSKKTDKESQVKEWNNLYNEADKKRAIETHLEGIITMLPWIALIDKFQHWIYTNPNHTNEERENKWEELHKELSSDVIDYNPYADFRKTMWHKQLHIFEVPFYYIEYGIAQLGAIAVWRNYKQNKHKAVEDYKNALKLGYTKSIPEMYKAAGIEFNFTAAYVKELMEFLNKEIEN